MDIGFLLPGIRAKARKDGFSGSVDVNFDGLHFIDRYGRDVGKISYFFLDECAGKKDYTKLLGEVSRVVSQITTEVPILWKKFYPDLATERFHEIVWRKFK